MESVCHTFSYVWLSDTKHCESISHGDVKQQKACQMLVVVKEFWLKWPDAVMHATLRTLYIWNSPQMSWPILFLSHLPCGHVDTNLPCATLPKDCTISWHSRTFTRTGAEHWTSHCGNSTLHCVVDFFWCRLSQKASKRNIPVPETNPAPWKRVIPCW